ncbi:hypothetical protein [Cohnella abietis]|uniref:Uncharacterized protein n=1 Tax=Cohnella abietis TaxID=2507935 RepID=A0A3T1CY23_9BACL|nr:hypothetical protein [Cohnella abietis]BBI30730.1 hypothetical protein KCTCHS21_01290 [Cohnella abietis]
MQTSEQLKTATINLLKNTELLREVRQRLIAEIRKITKGLTDLFDYPAFDSLVDSQVIHKYVFDLYYEGISMISDRVIAYENDNKIDQASIDQLTEENQRFFISKRSQITNQTKILNHSGNIYRRTMVDVEQSKEIIDNLEIVFSKVIDKMNEPDSMQQQEDNIFDCFNHECNKRYDGNHDMDQDDIVHQR